MGGEIYSLLKGLFRSTYKGKLGRGQALSNHWMDYLRRGNGFLDLWIFCGWQSVASRLAQIYAVVDRRFLTQSPVGGGAGACLHWLRADLSPIAAIAGHLIRAGHSELTEKSRI